MISFSHKLFELFKSIFSYLVSFKVFLLVILFLSPGHIAHGLDLSFAWDANTEPDLAGYKIFYREKGQNYNYNHPAWQGTQTTATIYNLDANDTYYFVARAYDIYDNESENSVELLYENGIMITSSGGGGGGCFIATAAYGSPFTPHVMLLRQFRDRFLLRTSAGRTFVHLYYTCSPSLADFISGHETLRRVVGWSLLPLVWLSWSLLKFGLLPTTLFLLLILSIITLGYISLKKNTVFKRGLPR